MLDGQPADGPVRTHSRALLPATGREIAPDSSDSSKAVGHSLRSRLALPRGDRQPTRHGVRRRGLSPLGAVPALLAAARARLARSRSSRTACVWSLLVVLRDPRGHPRLGLVADRSRATGRRSGGWRSPPCSSPRNWLLYIYGRQQRPGRRDVARLLHQPARDRADRRRCCSASGSTGSSGWRSGWARRPCSCSPSTTAGRRGSRSVLAFSFAIYGLIKKQVGPRVGAVASLSVESAVMFVPALAVPGRPRGARRRRLRPPRSRDTRPCWPARGSRPPYPCSSSRRPPAACRSP